jgi:hypothetical protein
VIPSLELVVAWNDTWLDTRPADNTAPYTSDPFNVAVQKLVAAVIACP